MKLNFFIIISLLVFSRFGHSQIITQPGEDLIKQLENDEFLKTSFINGGIGLNYQIDYQRSDEVVVQEYNEDFELQRKIRSKPKQKFLFQKGIYKIGAEVFIFRSAPMGDEEEVLSAFKLNKETLTFDTPIEVFRAARAKYGTNYIFSYSQDSSLLLISTDQRTKDGALSKNEYSFAVINSNGVLKWEEELERFSGKFDKEIYHDFQISNTGSLFLLSPNFNEDKKAKVDGFYYTYLIEEFNLPQEKINGFEAKLDTGYFKRSKLKILNNGNVSLCGFYSKEGNYQAGAFYKEYKNQVLQKSLTQRFQSKIILKYEPQSKRENAAQLESKGKDFKCPKFEIRTINISGKYPILIAEDVLMGTSTNYEVYYEYGNILVCNFSSSNTQNWQKIIAKKQYCKGISPDYISYGLVMEPSGKIDFIFNDHEENSSVEGVNKLTQWKANLKKADLILVSIDENGVTSRLKLLSTENSNVVTMPSKLQQNGANEAVVFGWNKKQTEFFKIVIPR